MKKLVVLGWLGMLLVVGMQSKAQEYEAQQLLLDWQKLIQEKTILQDLYTGYDILSKGYGAIRDISKGSFSLHKLFLDGLLSVSPVVKTYQRVADIIRMQQQIVKEYNAAWAVIRHETHFSPAEVGFIGSVYSGLFDRAMKNLGDLTNVVTDGVLRASDAERMDQIDGLYREMQGNELFLTACTNQAELLAVQRGADATDYEIVKKLYGLNS